MENLMFEEITEEEAFNIDGGGWLSWVGGVLGVAGIVVAFGAIAVATGGLGLAAAAAVGDLAAGAIAGGVLTYSVGVGMIISDNI